MGLKGWADKFYGVKEESIKKMASVDIASGGTLPLPEKGESVNIRFVSAPKQVVSEKLRNKEGALTARCVIYGRETDLQYDMWLTGTIYKGILSEFMKAKIPVDDDLKCIIGHVFTIAGREWIKAPDEMWTVDEVTKKPVAPKTYSVALRLDLEIRVTDMKREMNIEGGNSPDLMNWPE